MLVNQMSFSALTMNREDQLPPTILPTFFMIGAPKAGTTALSEYLRVHPDILFSIPKEPHYFNSDFSSRDTLTLDDYKRCFSHHSGESVIGEGSVFYLSSKVAVANIVRRVPDAKFIVMLRNPIEAVYSFHWQVVYSHEENVRDFERAWSLQADRQRGRYIPGRNKVREVLQYGTLFKYGEQLERLLRIAPKNAIEIVFYDDFKRDPGRVYQDVLSFLNVQNIALPRYEVINRSKKLRIPAVEEAMEFIDKLILSSGIKSKAGLKSLITRINTKYTQRPPLREGMKLTLVDYYKDDIRKTSELTGRSLEAWINA